MPTLYNNKRLLSRFIFNFLLPGRHPEGRKPLVMRLASALRFSPSRRPTQGAEKDRRLILCFFHMISPYYKRLLLHPSRKSL